MSSPHLNQKRFSLFRLPIILCEGIGDSLLILSFIPHETLSNIGINFNVFYISDRTKNPHYQLAGGLIRNLIESIKHFSYQERAPTAVEMRIFQWMLKILWRREVTVDYAKPKSILAWTWNSLQRVLRIKSIYPTILKNQEGLASISSESKGAIRLLFHTHLDIAFGDCKCWGTNNWIKTIGIIKKSNPNTRIDFSILEFNQEAANAIKITFPDVKILNEKINNFSSLVAIFRNFHCLIAVDSWTKYVAAWYDLEAVIIVPSQDGIHHWSNLSADLLLAWYFNGIYGKQNMDLLGLDVLNRKGVYSIPYISDLSPETLAKRIQGRIDRVNKIRKLGLTSE